ncbi:MAG: tRNA pseudouridine(38-40) synthase TruA [Lachnospiraceae bacterium]|nr:tRNA pseudouridine(38-40) synthase TruA [Lachnospiraceae bacterium]
MPNIKLVIAYDGTGYGGWQRTANAGKPCIQALLEERLTALLGETIHVIGSGRTDAGVHALAQTANFRCRVRKEAGELCRELNRALPEDIRIRSAEVVKNSFHSRYDAAAKTYEYHIDLRNPANVFTRRYCYQEQGELSEERMRKAGALLIGTHDFAAFSTSRGDGRSTVRTIYDLSVERRGDAMVIAVTGNGFLYHMVRIIAGTLIEVGRGERRPEEITEMLAGGTRSLAGWMAPAQGLYLKEVQYEHI